MSAGNSSTSLPPLGPNARRDGGVPRKRPRTFVVFRGVPVDDVTLAGAVQRFDDFVRRGRSGGLTHQVATVNLEFLVNAQRAEDVHDILQQTDLSVPDGMPLVWGSRLLGAPFSERVTGAELVPALAEMCAQKSYTLMLFGSGPGVAEAAANKLVVQFPGLRVVGLGGPPFRVVEEMEPSVLDAIRAVDPDILCVALGNPKQERWIATYRDRLGTPVLIGVGGSLDFIAGEQPRAPKIMQRTGTEWIYRLVHEPRRLYRRYLRCLAYFPPMIVSQLWTMRPVATGDRTTITGFGSVVVRSGTRLDVSVGSLTSDDIARLEDCDGLTVDLSEVRRLDHATVSSLFVLRDLAGGFTLEGVRPAIQRSFDRHGLTQTFAVRDVAGRRLPVSSRQTTPGP